MKELPANQAYRLLEAGPVVLVATADRKGKPNLMTMGFHMMIEHDPPLVGAIVGPWDHSYAALRATRSCVIAVPGADLARQAVGIGNCTGSEVDKFAKFKLTPLPAKEVAAPLVAECLANVECRVHDTALVRKYGLFVLRAVRVWIDPKRKERRTLHHHGDGTFSADGRLLNLRSRMVRWKAFQTGRPGLPR